MVEREEGMLERLGGDRFLEIVRAQVWTARFVYVRNVRYNSQNQVNHYYLPQGWKRYQYRLVLVEWKDMHKIMSPNVRNKWTYIQVIDMVFFSLTKVTVSPGHVIRENQKFRDDETHTEISPEDRAECCLQSQCVPVAWGSGLRHETNANFG